MGGGRNTPANVFGKNSPPEFSKLALENKNKKIYNLATHAIYTLYVTLKKLSNRKNLDSKYIPILFP